MSDLTADTALRVDNLHVFFKVARGPFKTEIKTLKAVNNISFSVKRNRILGLVGESGCGKSTVARSLLRAVEPTEGQVFYRRTDGEVVDLATIRERDFRPFRNELQMIFQDPFSSLNPRYTIKEIIGEPLKVKRVPVTEREERIRVLMDKVDLNPLFMTRYPHAFSGGQRQRISIARALAAEPSVIIADEPVSALDVSIQSQILNLLTDIQRERDLTMIFISHNLNVIRFICDEIIVMYLGHIVEQGEIDTVYEHPLHPYTRALLSAVPDMDPDEPWEEEVLEGDVPSPLDDRGGCPFHTRCAYCKELCRKEKPALVEYDSGQLAACHYVNGITDRVGN